MSSDLQYLDALRRKRCPVRLGARLPMGAEPLCRDGSAILEAGVSDIAVRYGCVPRQPLRNPMRIGIGLANLQPVMFARSGELDRQIFYDVEVLAARADASGEKRSAERAGPVRKMRQGWTQRDASATGTTW